MLRIYLSGRMTLENDGKLFGPNEFPGPQGRATFALLAGERRGPIPREALATALWPAEPPRAWPGALASIVSKLRALLSAAGLDGQEVLSYEGSCYELRLPTDSWIDHQAAEDEIHKAETALQAGDVAAAYGPSAVAHHISRRTFLPSESGAWFERRREKLAGILVRALECRAEVYLRNGEHPLAAVAAQELVTLQPFRESGYRLLMRAHTAAGNTAEALRVYDSCRKLIAEELGVPPSPETQAVHEGVLRML